MTNELRECPMCGETTHDEICDKALAHYDDVSRATCDWCSTVVHAIKFYKRYGPATPTLDARAAAEDAQQKLNRAVMYALREGCFFPVPEPQKGASVEELVKWGAMRDLHDAIAEFNRAPAPASGEKVDTVAVYRDALETIRDCDIECTCEHDNENCCAVVHEYCPFCIAAVALRAAAHKED